MPFHLRHHRRTFNSLETYADVGGIRYARNKMMGLGKPGTQFSIARQQRFDHAPQMDLEQMGVMVNALYKQIQRDGRDDQQRMEISDTVRTTLTRCKANNLHHQTPSNSSWLSCQRRFRRIWDSAARSNTSFRPTAQVMRCRRKIQFGHQHLGRKGESAVHHLRRLCGKYASGAAMGRRRCIDGQ